jgi:hypothetical protein
MYKVTLSVSYIDLEFIFEDIQDAMNFIEDILTKFNRDSTERTIRVNIDLVLAEEDKEEGEVESDE